MGSLPTYAEHLLPSTQTPMEKIFSAAAEARVAGIPAPIDLLNDAYATPVQFLNALAFEVGVDIWDETWPEIKKRRVIQDTIGLKKILGTIGAIRAYVEIEDGRLVDYVVPPQTPYVSKALTDAEYEDWLGKLPQIRVYFGNERGAVSDGQSFVARSFVGSAFLTKDNGRDLLGRHAYLYDPLTDEQSRITLADLGIQGDQGDVEERAFVPGKAGPMEAFPGRFVGQVYVAEPMKAPSTVSYGLRQASTDPDIGSLVLALGASFDAATTRYDRVPVSGVAVEGTAFIGSSTIGQGIILADDAEIGFYDRIFLADPSIPAPATVGTTYVGRSRLQIQPYRAELLIDAQENIDPKRAVEGRFVGNCFVAAQDDRKRNRIMNAVELAKAGRDRIYVDFQVTEILTFADAPTLDGSTSFGERLPRARL